MSRGEPTTAQIEVWQAYLRSHVRLIARLDDELQAAHSLPLEWYDVLVQLDDVGGRSSMGDLAKSLLISPSNCTRRVDRMVAAGLVLRHRDDSDRRVRIVELTDSGDEQLRQASPGHLAGVQRYFTRYLTPRNRPVVADFLDRIESSLETTERGLADPS